jgi:hypothetical protein
MQTYAFEVQLRQDTELPIKFSPKAAVQAILWEPWLLQTTLNADLLVGSVMFFLMMQELSHDPQLQSTIQIH